MKVLVTGATGFIGKEIVSKLLDEQFDVCAAARNVQPGESEKNAEKVVTAGPEVIFARLDITDQRGVMNFAERESFDAVIHCAGLAHQFGRVEKEHFENVNVGGTRNIAELAVRVKAKHFILISSTAIYGLQNKPMDETAECKPETYYAESKLRAEKVCREICEKNKIPLTILRLAPVLGEKGIGNLPRLIESVHRKRFIWVGKGENKKSLIYVRDVAGACCKLLREKRNMTEVFNVSAAPIRMKSLVKIISGRLNKKVPGFSVPASVPKLIFDLNWKIIKSNTIGRISQTFDKWLSEDIYPAEKIKAEYGFEPRTTIEQAVIRQCEWFLEQKRGVGRITKK